ncbi:MAG: D-alanyl-D-alanine carboxypeptidase [Oscillospiraceae bacterium]|nr:D-alanyl-D-alanine carboxypeptidase [Oscillospiraceae bacterium]MBQ4117346.1 D-alanyl-D-alanine carboxypeptidase [Oscillospiraceae bacterium]MBQ6699683.1 D-alanyl-D-alanine carboxypeptidase [Oscillospiraceae bacterium]MBQ6802914.1 D-alanyl-D-alanine carboxypeptidase [Oscillospiraceae bacterium]
MKKILSFILAAVMAFSCCITAFAATKYQPSFEVDCESVYLADENGNVLFEQNPNQRMYPAELTQIMTAIVVIENIEAVGGWTAEAAYEMSTQNFLYENRHGIVSTGMLAGNVFTADELFHSMVIASGYDAAMTLAKLIAGSQDAFVELMNQKAMELGARDTNFTNCHGLHDTANYTTAYDMYLISRYAMSLDKFKETVAKTAYTCEATDTHKKLVWNTDNGLLASGNVHYYSPVTGIKSGYSAEIGRNVASYAEYEGFSYYQINMGAPFELDEGYNLALKNAKDLYVWAFTEFEVKTIVEAGSQLCEVPLELAWQKDYLKLMVGDTYRALLPIDVDIASITYDYDVPESVEAPIEKGEAIGKLNLIHSGEVIGSVPLVSAEDVEQSELLSGLKNFSDMTRSFWFKFIVITFFILVALYIALMIIRNYNHRKYGNFKRKKRL